MKEKVYNYLKGLGIEYVNYDHPPLFTCDDNNKYGLEFDGMGCKNLFLRNQNKSAYYLVSMPDSKRIDLKTLAEKIGEKKLSFASENDLFDKLKITPGAVSVLNVIENDKKDVICILDKDMVPEKVGFHPNENTSTLFFEGKNLEKILKSLDIEYRFIEI